MREYKPNPIIINKACELWALMLFNPKFDALGKNGFRDDPSGAMFLAQGLASINADSHKADSGALEKFKDSLKKYLNSKLSFNNETKEFDITEDGYFHTSLAVDYHPDYILKMAAKEAGISEEIFPWKTNMYLSNDRLSLSYGYGSEYVNYYPFDGKWLITTLSGSEIHKVIEYVRGGKPEFKIEQEQKKCDPTEA